MGELVNSGQRINVPEGTSEARLFSLRLVQFWGAGQRSIAVSDNYAYVADGPSGLVILPAQCDSGVAAYLSAFKLHLQQAAVFIRWQVLADGAPVVFRLLGSDGQREWEVPYVADPGVPIYNAEDRSLHLRGRSEVSYRLLMNRDGQDWSVLKTATARLQGMPSPHSQILSTSPNPFNPRTTIRFQCAQAGRVQLSIHDLAGRRVVRLVEEWLPSGAHERVWDGRDGSSKAVASGQYIVRLQTQDRIDTQRIVLLK